MSDDLVEMVASDIHESLRNGEGAPWLLMVVADPEAAEMIRKIARAAILSIAKRQANA